MMGVMRERDTSRLGQQLARLLPEIAPLEDIRPAEGGSIAECFRVRTSAGREYFVKYQNRSLPGAFHAEFESLACLRRCAEQVLRIPEPLAYDDDLLVMEAFEAGRPGPDWQELMGRGLAHLHARSRRQGFGFAHDNYLGFSPQPNRWQDSWAAFWAGQRLQPQISRLAETLGTDDRLVREAEHLLTRLDHYLGDVPGQSVLLHGDLWSGNAAADTGGFPVIFDPASYFGHHEAEFGMMRLFGGFDERCEHAYREVLPFQAGHEERITLYRLYHEMNHLLLFGGAYYRACRQTLSQLL